MGSGRTALPGAHTAAHAPCLAVEAIMSVYILPWALSLLVCSWGVPAALTPWSSHAGKAML